MLGGCALHLTPSPRVLPLLACAAQPLLRRIARKMSAFSTRTGGFLDATEGGFLHATASTVVAPPERAAVAEASSGVEDAADPLSGLMSPKRLRAEQRAGGAYSPDLTRALKAVVKVFTTSASPNFSQPWTYLSQTKCTASGFAISPLSQRRILTNAHAVSQQVMVKVRKHGSAQKFAARVLAVGHECDIAMLTVDDDEFWTDIEPLDISGLPAMQSEVMVVGFPQGGDNVCVTKGVVSRIDRQQYSHGRTSLLAIQVDAAINSGNSGGPVVLGSHVVGVAFQSLTSGDGVGYIIPTPVINHFLKDLERNGRYTGFCELGVSWQNLENAGMKAALRLPKLATGVLITKTDPLSPAAACLARGDVLTHLDGVPIADDGTFLFREAVRIDYRHLPSCRFEGDRMKARVWRDGRPLEVDVTVRVPDQLVPAHSHDAQPDYYIYAGLMFTPLTCFYLKSQYGADWASKAPIKLCERAFAGVMEAPGQQVVVLSKVFAADINTGYQDLANVQLLRVDGVGVVNLGHAAALIEAAKGPFVKLELEWNKVVYIDQAKALACASELLRQNAIPAAHSAALVKAPPQPRAAAKAAPAPAPAAAADGAASDGDDGGAEAPRTPEGSDGEEEGEEEAVEAVVVGAIAAAGAKL